MKNNRFNFFQSIHSVFASAGAIFIWFFLGASAYAAPGDLDPTFDLDGTVATAIGGPSFAGADYATAMAHTILPNGMIMVAGTAHGTTFGKTDFLVARYYPDGSLDTSFGATGTTGVSIIDFGTATIDYVYGLAIQADGKIVLAGTTYDSTTSDDFALMRFHVNGTLDTSFGNGGKVRTDFGAKKQDTATGVAIQADGMIVVVGYTDIGGSTNYEFALARYNANGTLDSTFGSGGKVKTGFATNSDWARAVVLQADGKIIAAGGKGGDFALARYNTNGSLDTTFDGDGKASTSFGTQIDTIYALRLQADGNIVAAGAVNDNGVGDSDIGIARYTSAGKLDTTFDGDGKLVTQVGLSESAAGVVIQADGKIVVAGTARMPDTDNDFALVRYGVNGAIDTSFGKNGVVTTPTPGTNGSIGSIAYGLALDGDGKFVVVGATDIILARYLSK